MLDKTCPTPIYYQLKELIREKIENGEWQPGDLIPSERELCEQHGISRMTVRQALTELVNEGLLRRERGKGTFVAKPKIKQQLTQLTSFSEDMRARGKKPGAKILRLENTLAKPRVAKALQIEPEQRIVVIERLRLADGEPMAIETCHLFFEGCERILNEDLSGSLYELLSQKYGLIPTRAVQQMEAAICNQREMELLQLERGSPVLLNKRTTFAQNGQPFEYTESVYRGDKYTFYAELTARRDHAV